MPLAVVAAAPGQQLIPLVVAVSLLCPVLLGALGAQAGGAPVMRSLVRVTFWGPLAMALTAGVGSLFVPDVSRARCTAFVSAPRALSLMPTDNGDNSCTCQNKATN